jgi:hypothetical protein
VLFGCEKCRTYLEHKEFELRCDNLALCWLLKRVKDVGRLGRWIQCLAPFKFKVVHTRGKDNVVADALSRMFEKETAENPEYSCAVLRESLPLVYSSLAEHQREDAFCRDLYGKVQQAQAGANNFKVQKGSLGYPPKGAKRCRWVVPTSLKAMLLKYFHCKLPATSQGRYRPKNTGNIQDLMRVW